MASICCQQKRVFFPSATSTKPGLGRGVGLDAMAMAIYFIGIWPWRGLELF